MKFRKSFSTEKPENVRKFVRFLQEHLVFCKTLFRDLPKSYVVLCQESLGRNNTRFLDPPNSQLWSIEGHLQCLPCVLFVLENCPHRAFGTRGGEMCA